MYTKQYEYKSFAQTTHNVIGLVMVLAPDERIKSKSKNGFSLYDRFNMLKLSTNELNINIDLCQLYGSDLIQYLNCVCCEAITRFARRTLFASEGIFQTKFEKCDLNNICENNAELIFVCGSDTIEYNYAHMPEKTKFIVVRCINFVDEKHDENITYIGKTCNMIRMSSTDIRSKIAGNVSANKLLKYVHHDVLNYLSAQKLKTKDLAVGI